MGMTLKRTGVRGRKPLRRKDSARGLATAGRRCPALHVRVVGMPSSENARALQHTQ